MKKNLKKKLLDKKWYSKSIIKIDYVSYIIVLLTAILFFSYIGFFENIDVYKGRAEAETRVLNDVYEITNVIDENTPIGIKNQYKWTLNDLGKRDKHIAFYLVHQSTEVYIDGNLIYSLKLQEDNKIGKTPANNWAMIPIFPEDYGKEICVNIIPSYSYVEDLKVEFIIGSKFNIYFNQLKSEVPQMFLIFVALIVGMIFIIISVVNKYKKKNNLNLIYLAAFSISIAIFKVTDTKSAPLIFSRNTVVLSYISITMISVSIISFLICLKEQFLKRYYHIVKMIIVSYSIFTLAIIFVQIANIADLRESLIFVHSTIAIIAVVIAVLAIHQGIHNRSNEKARTLSMCTILCVVGVFIDLLTYYIGGNSDNAQFTLAALDIYVIITGYLYIIDINKMANLDTHTGLFNKGRCNELLDENEKIVHPLGIMMFDLNKLKYINDNFGHENGDLLISEFAKIIRNNIDDKYFLGRFGGDEFIAVIDGADDTIIKCINNDIAKDVYEYNKKNSKFTISYSFGYALSIDYSELSLRELLEKADEFMYSNKKEYHLNN